VCHAATCSDDLERAPHTGRVARRAAREFDRLRQIKAGDELFRALSVRWTSTASRR
jgi:hypothetical protein